MKLEKKSQLNKFWLIGGLIMVFGIIIFMYLFFSVGLKQIIGEELIQPVFNATLNATSNLLTSGTITTINDMETIWHTDFLNFDLFFLFMFLVFVIELFYTTSKISIDNIFSFFGLITIGNMLFLFVLVFVSQIRDWLILNFYTNLFDLSMVNTPIIDIFISNIAMISFILFLICILIATLDWQQVKGKLSGFNSNERVEQ